MEKVIKNVILNIMYNENIQSMNNFHNFPEKFFTNGVK